MRSRSVVGYTVLMGLVGLLTAGLVGCDEEERTVQRLALDPDTAPRVVVDRFSAESGTLMVRDDSNGLPGAGEPIELDAPPFLTTSLGPDGRRVQYYNFDVQPLAPAVLYLVFRDGEDSPVQGQLPIINVLPGDPGYSDFWRIYRIIAPADYVANTVTSFDGVYDAELFIESTEAIVNCPVVPEGSTADLRIGETSVSPAPAWYRDQVAFLFKFEEAALLVTPQGEVERSPIFVTFNVNPDQPDGGPASGFVTEPGSDQTHNVVSTLPGDAAYSPFWSVHVYDNGAFDAVSDLATAVDATRLGDDVAQVNCPVVFVAP
jgi:hypothetical protein